MIPWNPFGRVSVTRDQVFIVGLLFWILYVVVYLKWRWKEIEKFRAFIKEMSPRDAGRLNNGYIAFGPAWGFSAKYASTSDKFVINRRANIVRGRLILFHPAILFCLFFVLVDQSAVTIFIALYALFIMTFKWLTHRNH